MSCKDISIFNKTIVFCALFVAFILSITSCQKQPGSWQLVIKEPDSLIEIYVIEVVPGSTFELSYRHSVSASMVYGTFIISDQGMIEPLATSYTSFGPGLPLDYAEEYTIANGVITVHHQVEPRERIRLWVSAVTEDMITISDQSYPLYSETENHRLVEIFLAQ